MATVTNPERKMICAENVARLIRQNKEIRTIEKFAELVDKDVKTVSRWINGGINKLSNVKLCADVLGVPDTEILL